VTWGEAELEDTHEERVTVVDTRADDCMYKGGKECRGV